MYILETIFETLATKVDLRQSYRINIDIKNEMQRG